MKTNHPFICVLFPILIAGCAKFESGPAVGERQTVISAVPEELQSDSPASKAVIGPAGLFNWEVNDVIGIACTASNGTTSFVPFTNTTGNSFTGQLSGTDVLGRVAVFPHTAVKSYEGDNLVLTLPESYVYSVKPPLYMVANSVDNTKYTLKHAAAMIRFQFLGVPADASYLEFTSDKRLTGDFPLSLATPGAIVSITTEASSSGNKVTVTDIPAPGNFTVDIPVPTATLNSFTVALKKADGTDISGFVRTTASGKTFTASRAKLLVIPAIGFTPSPIPDTHPFKRLAEYNVSATPKVFTTSHDTDKSGYFKQADALAACPDGYHLPSKAEFNEFVPDYDNVNKTHVIFSSYKAYRIHAGIAYKYVLQNYNKPNAAIVVTARNLGSNNVALADISNDSFWSANKAHDVVKVFPVCGRISNGQTTPNNVNIRAVYATASNAANGGAWYTQSYSDFWGLESWNGLQNVSATVRCIQD